MVLVPFCTTRYLEKRLGHSITILIILNSTYVQRDEIEMKRKMKPNFRLCFNKTFKAWQAWQAWQAFACHALRVLLKYRQKIGFIFLFISISSRCISRVQNNQNTTINYYNSSICTNILLQILERPKAKSRD